MMSNSFLKQKDWKVQLQDSEDLKYETIQYQRVILSQKQIKATRSSKTKGSLKNH